MRNAPLVGLAGVFALACSASGPEGEQGTLLDENSRIAGNTATGRNAPNEALSAGKKHSIGTLTTLLAGLDTETTRLSKRFSFPKGPFGQVRAIVDDFHHEDGYLSMIGKPLDGVDAEFMLKADESEAYGWIVYRDRNVAFEYTTDARGNVLVEEVPVTKIFPVCNFDKLGDSAHDAPPDDIHLHASPMLPPHIGNYSNADITKLQSRPGAPKVWYIDLTDVLNGTTPIGQTPTDVWQTWQSLSAALSAFDVNVTTDPAVYTAAGTRNSGVASMANVNEGSSSCGLNVFGSTRACDVHRYRNGYSTGRILSHEVGHGLGMGHDGGDNGGEYFNGFSSFQWTPLMGNIWPGDRWMQALYQWSRGEYNSATNDEDDFANLDRHLDYLADDIPATKPLAITGSSVARTSNWGQIGRNTDSDTFTFRIGTSGGRAELLIDRIEYIGGAMLDVDASIVNASGNVVLQNNAAVARNAELEVDLPAGDYNLVIKGGGEGTPANGFSNYSSVGFYGIEGTLTGATSTGTGGGAGSGGMGGIAGMGGASGSAGMGGAVGGSGGNAGTGNGGDGAAGLAGASTGGSGGVAGGGGVPGGGTGAAGMGGAGAAAGAGGIAIPTGGSAGSPGTAGSISTAGQAPAPASPTNDDAGCGCRTNTKSGTSPAWLMGIALMGIGALRRRRA